MGRRLIKFLVISLMAAERDTDWIISIRDSPAGMSCLLSGPRIQHSGAIVATGFFALRPFHCLGRDTLWIGNRNKLAC
jgi:hypothetical protein